jgi:MFS family permease
MLDRTMLNPLIEPIKHQFALSDTQMGYLSGFTFAVFYTTVGLPLAWLADRRNRVNLIALAIVGWSCFTTFTGFSRSFAQLLVARVGVGIGEAGCNPAAYSLISDYFPKERRATALGIYHMGGSIGVFAGFILVGFVAQRYGWQACFFIVGIPGLLLALTLKLTCREPPRGLSDTLHVTVAPSAAWTLLKRLLCKPAFRHIAAGCALINFVIYGVGNFVPSYLQRCHGFSIGKTSYLLAFVSLGGGLLGTYFGARASDFLASKYEDPRFYLWVPAVALILSVPFAEIAYGTSNPTLAVAMLVPSGVLVLTYLSPSIAAAYRFVGAQERALTAALLLLILNFIGLGLGPVVTGFISDRFKDHFLSQGATNIQASADGLRWALRVMPLTGFWAAFHFLMGARTLRQESRAD